VTRDVTALFVCVACSACYTSRADETSHTVAPALPATIHPPAVASVAPPVEPSPAHAKPEVKTDWCVDGLAALDEETCYALPERGPDASAPALLVYLHGIIPPVASSPQKERVELAVLHATRRAGAAALVPRGVRGIGPSGARDWWAWPTEPEAHAKYAASLVAKWVKARQRLEEIAGAPFSRTYLAGSSNGAYFLTALALRGELEQLGFHVDGFGAMSGGSAGGREPSAPPAARSPFYVGHGAYDESTRTSARALVALLARAKWPAREHELPVGHGAREEYIDDAFAFWSEESR
jgi:predicted esterase